MSETEPKPPMEVKCLIPDSKILIEVPASLHYRIQCLLMVGMPFDNIEALQKTIANIKNSMDDPDPQTFHSRTLIWLLSLIEEAAEKQGKIETKKVDAVTGKFI